MSKNNMVSALLTQIPLLGDGDDSYMILYSLLLVTNDGPEYINILNRNMWDLQVIQYVNLGSNRIIVLS